MVAINSSSTYSSGRREVYSDLSHHLSSESRARLANPMKAIWKLAHGRPNMVSLANGDPHYTLYPIRKVEFEVPSVSGEDPVASWREGSGSSQIFGSYMHEPCSLSLKTALQYSTGAGLTETQQALNNLTKLFHHPPNHVVTLTLGNADGVSKCFRMLGDRGDTFITEEFSFSGLTNVPLSQGIHWAPVKTDEGGMIPEDLEKMLSNWDEVERGRRPRVLYTVPCGQNPTGFTLNRERRRRIYKLAQQWDMIIIEDDPYYFLQYDLSVPNGAAAHETSDVQFASKFIPSFVSMDVDGRVLRVDSFSKILAPGMRLGWITSSHMFHEHLVSLTDSSSQHPHGIGQAFISEMLGPRGWQTSGFINWVASLCRDYQRRRDYFMDVFKREVGCTGFATADPPQAGMFVWLRVNIESHPRFHRSDCKRPARTNTAALMEQLFHECLDAGLVLMPASVFAILGDTKHVVKDDDTLDIRDRLNYFRATFAGTEQTIDQGLGIFAQVLERFFTET